MAQQGKPSAKRNAAVVIFALGVLSVSGLAAEQVPGVTNFHQVSTQVFRGAQPTNEGFQSLAKLGIKTVIDLRESGPRSKAEEQTVTAAGMRYVSIPMEGLTAPSNEAVKSALALFDDSSAGPVFIHCRRGADRTGTVCACYRIAHDHWDNAKALAEARSLGMSWVERAMQNYVLHFAWPSVPSVVNALPTSQ